MGRYSPLFKSVVILVIFWWLVGLITYSMMPYWALAQWLEYVGAPLSEPVTPLNHLAVIYNEVSRLSRQAFFSGAYGLAVACVIVVLYLFAYRKRIKNRALADRSWRGVKVSRGKLDTLKEINYSSSVNLPKSLKLTKKQTALINAVLGYLSDNKQAFVGPGHKGTLLDHTLGAMSTAIELHPKDGMLAVCIACHDMGKTVAWEKNNKGEWQQLGWHAQEGAKLLARFPEWWALPEEERLQVRYVVAYNHSPHRLPAKINGLSLDGYHRLKELIEKTREVDGVSTAFEKQETLEELDLPELALKSFLTALLDIPYHEDGKQLPKGVEGAGWRVGGRLYLLEHRVRDAAMKRLDENVFAALGGQYRSQGRLADYTKALFTALEQKGWLVLEFEPHEKNLLPGQKLEDAEPITVPNFYPLIKLRSINKNGSPFTFDGVFAVELPEGENNVYPRLEAPGQVFAVAPIQPPAEVIAEAKGELEAKEKPKKADKKPAKKGSKKQKASTKPPTERSSDGAESAVKDKKTTKKAAPKKAKKKDEEQIELFSDEKPSSTAKENSAPKPEKNQKNKAKEKPKAAPKKEREKAAETPEKRETKKETVKKQAVAPAQKAATPKPKSKADKEVSSKKKDNSEKTKDSKNTESNNVLPEKTLDADKVAARQKLKEERAANYNTLIDPDMAAMLAGSAVKVANTTGKAVKRQSERSRANETN